MARPARSYVLWCRWPKCSVMQLHCVSATQGRASYAMEFAKYHDAPTNVAQAVIEERKSK